MPPGVGGSSSQKESLKMIGKTLEMGNSELFVVGPIYNKIDKLPLIEKFAEDKTIVFLGDVSYPNDSFGKISERIGLLRSFCDAKRCFYVLGDKDLLYMKQIVNSHADTHDWLSQQKKALRFSFANNTNLVIVHGGILPSHKDWKELQTDPESSFVTNFNEKPWQESYDGRFGYVISSHPVHEEVKFYNNSLSLDTLCHESDKLATQIFGPKGAGQTIYL